MDGVKNWDHVFVDQEYAGPYRWTFRTPVDGREPGRVTRRVLDVADAVFAATDGFLRPTNVVYRHVSVDGTGNDGPIEIGSERRSLGRFRDDGGVDPRRAISETREALEGIDEPGVPEVVTASIDARVRLSDGYHYAGTSHPAVYREYYKGTATGTPNFEPVLVRVEARPTLPFYDPALEPGAADESGDVVVLATVTTRLPVWFEDTPVGRINRHNLGTALAEIYREVPDVDLYVHRETGSRWDRIRFFGDEHERGYVDGQWPGERLMRKVVFEERYDEAEQAELVDDDTYGVRLAVLQELEDRRQSEAETVEELATLLRSRNRRSAKAVVATAIDVVETFDDFEALFTRAFARCATDPRIADPILDGLAEVVPRRTGDLDFDEEVRAIAPLLTKPDHSAAAARVLERLIDDRSLESTLADERVQAVLEEAEGDAVDRPDARSDDPP